LSEWFAANGQPLDGTARSMRVADRFDDGPFGRKLGKLCQRLLTRQSKGVDFGR